MITIEDVIQNAKIVGIDVSNGRSSEVWATDLLEFARQFVINEREQCAKVCEEEITIDDEAFNDGVYACINSIKARGE